MKYKTLRDLKRIAEGNLHRHDIPEDIFLDFSRQGYIEPTSNKNDMLVIAENGKKKIEEESYKQTILIIAVATLIVATLTLIATIVC